MTFFQAGIKRSALQAQRLPFVCRQCLRGQKLSLPQQQPRRLLSSIVRWRRSYATARSTPPPPLASNADATAASPLASLSSKITAGQVGTAAAEAASGGAGAKAKSSSSSSSSPFPEATTSRAVAYWLIGSAASVFGIVVFGGLTRLTESGLSITEWRPVTGSLPPMSQSDWEAEFAKYRASPEYALLNPHMTLDEFRKIYYMEWTHRLWGRLVGLSFVLPAAYFVARRRVSARMAAHLAGIAGLIGFQGFLGWWMVKSGLRDDLFAPGSHPRVSQYRLAAHLATAFVCYSWMLLAGLRVLRTRRLLLRLAGGADPAAVAAQLAALRSPALRPLRRAVTGLTGLVFVTVLSGALVAGLDAGLIYNEFPMMGLGLTPPKSELWDRFYCRREDGADLWWRNLLENPSLVQLDHRILASTTFCAVLALFFWARRGRVGAAMPADVRKGVTGLVHLASLQVILGISTLIYMVPVHLAATHQAGALALLTGALVLGHRLRVPPATLRVVEKRIKAAAASAAAKASKA